MRTLNVALVGCGGRGTGAGANVLSSAGNTVRIVAMADMFSERLQSSYDTLRNLSPTRVDVPSSRRFVGLQAYRSAINAADVVVLATPPAFYPQHLAYAVARNKHVFLEKPVAVDATGVRSVLASAAEADVRRLSIAVGFQHLHEDRVEQTVARIRSGALGRLLYARASYEAGSVLRYSRRATDTELLAQIRDWYNYVWLSGDIIVEQNVHVIANVCWIKGEFPVSCHGMGGRQVRVDPKYGQIYDHFCVEFEFADGFRLLNRCRQIDGATVNVNEYIVGDQGTCLLGSGAIEGSNPWKYTGTSPNPYQHEIDVWLSSIRNQSPRNEAYFGAHATLTAIMGRQAAYTGRVITWADALASQEDLAPEINSTATPAPVVRDARGRYPVALPGHGYSLGLDASRVDPARVTLDFHGVAGWMYRLQGAPTIEGPWSAIGTDFAADGNPQQIQAPRFADSQGYYRFELVRRD